ncbi:hypothetical protein GCM10023194_40870 [Planotetraspora phitsanulokensis]|uniref:Uncharacterized protein n=1 Tax=Planotetraspora phitsanulokensis TaxID=575192 RepID=A0A8J3XH98_9ACTN|nr:hypothetical protein [Planotetraspora phitsanulokensis]GII40925.1 hypothetical protein Pph01_59280 [Planotetraspora phitsanulokensis]
MMTTDSTARSEFIAGLRRLAAFLADNPKVPVSTGGLDVTVLAEGTDRQQRAAVDRIAHLIGAPTSDSTFYVAARDFGPITYRAVAIPAEQSRDYDAWSTYYGAVTA